MSIESIGPKGPNREDVSPKTTEKIADSGRWLAELEKDSFTVKDDKIRLGLSTIAGMISRPVEHQPESQPEPNRESTGQKLAWPDVTALNPAATLPFNVAFTENGARPQQPMVNIAANQKSLRTLRPSMNGPESLKSIQRFDALVNKMQFADFNVQVTRTGSQSTLWIRDFKQKYGPELYQWVRELQSLMKESGQAFHKIMVNGKPLAHINQLLGGL
jgi:hypothetical protein